MTRVCCINNCLSGSAHDPDPEKRFIFQIPKEESTRQKWLEFILPNIKGKKIRKNYYVCELHFQKDDIQSFFVMDPQNKENTKVKRDRVTLQRGSVPSILKRSGQTPNNLEHAAVTPDNQHQSSISKCLSPNNILNKAFSNEKKILESDFALNMMDTDHLSSNSSILNPDIPSSPEDIPVASYNLLDFKNDLVKLLVSSSFPLDWSFHESKTNDIVISYYGEDSRKSTRSIVVKPDMSIQVYIYDVLSNQLMESNKITCFQDILTAMTKLVQAAEKELVQGLTIFKNKIERL